MSVAAGLGNLAWICARSCVIVSTEDHMARFTTRGTDLFDAGGNRIATVRDGAIYDAGDNKIAALCHPEVYDSQGNRVAILRGSDIYDERNRKIATISDVYKDIDSLLCGSALVGLWLFFVRRQSSTSQSALSAGRPPNAFWNLFRQMLRFRKARR